MVVALTAEVANRDLTALEHIRDVRQSLLVHRRALLFSEGNRRGFAETKEDGTEQKLHGRGIGALPWAEHVL